MSKSQITVTVSKEQKALWQEWAAKKGLTTSSFIRRCVTICVEAYERKERAKHQG